MLLAQLLSSNLVRRAHEAPVPIVHGTDSKTNMSHSFSSNVSLPEARDNCHESSRIARYLIIMTDFGERLAEMWDWFSAESTTNDAGNSKLNGAVNGKDHLWRLVRISVSLLLSAAVFTKWSNFIPILLGDGLLSSLPLLLAAIAVEAALAFYLLIGNPQWSWRFTVALFLAFFVASAYAFLTSQQCNCFGETIGPGWMLAIDAMVLFVSLSARPSSSEKNWATLSLSPLLISVLVGAAVAGSAFHQSRATSDNTLEFLLADQMLGRKWPIDSSVNPELELLSEGRWLVFVFRRDCGHCRELVHKFFDNPNRHRRSERTITFLAGTDSWPFKLDLVSLEFATNFSVMWGDHEPFVASPAIFVLRDGIVVEAADGNETDRMLFKLLEGK